MFQIQSARLWPVHASSGLVLGLLAFLACAVAPGVAVAQLRLTEVGRGPSNVQQLRLDAGAVHGGLPFLVLGSGRGVPGVRVGSVYLPLSIDAYSMATLANPSMHGVLDVSGRAERRIEIPFAVRPYFAHKRAHHAALLFDRALRPLAASNAVPLDWNRSLRPQAAMQLSYGALCGGRFLAGVDAQGCIYVLGEWSGPDINPPADSESSGRALMKIDPSLPGDQSIRWITRFGGASVTIPFGAAFGEDGQGNPRVYVCGWTFQGSLGSNSFDPTIAPDRDGFVVAFDANDGSRVAGAFVGAGLASANRTAISVTVAAGHVYVVGEAGGDVKVTANALDSVHDGGSDAFCLKATADLSTLVWSTLLPGGSSYENALAVTVDAADNVFIGGRIDSSVSGISATYPIGFDQTANGGDDGYVLKIAQINNGADPVGSAFTYLGGSGNEEIHSLVAGSSIWLAGRSESNDFPQASGSLSGRSDLILARLSANLTQIQWARYFGGSKTDGGSSHLNAAFHRVAGIAVQNDRLYLAASTKSANLPVTSGAIDSTHDSSPRRRDAFVARFSNATTTPQLTELTYLGGGGEDQPTGFVHVDAAGDLYVAAEAEANAFDDKTTTLSHEDTGYVAKVHFDDPLPVPPDAPTGLSASGMSCSRIDLSWTDADSREDGFKVDRSVAGLGAWVQIAQTSANVTTYADTGLAPQSTWDYRVRAFNAHGDSGWSNTATATTQSSPPIGTHDANGEQAVDGTVSGSYAATHASDNVYQSIRERESGGKKKDRFSFLEHRWSFELPCSATSLTLSVEAYRTDSGEGDTFVFDWSSDGQSWTQVPSLAITKTSDDDAAQTAALPAALSGTLWIRVRDSDRTAGNRALDRVFVDRLFILSQ